MKFLSKSIIIITSIIVTLSSCNTDPCATKESFIKHFDSFVSEFETKKANLSSDEKQVYEDQYRDLVENCYKVHKGNMTLSEKQTFWKGSLAFYINRFEGDLVLQLTERMDDPLNQYIKDEVIGLVKESGITFLFSLQSVLKDELPKLIEAFSAEIQKLGDELINELQEQ